MGLIGLLFNLATFPGIIVNALVQRVLAIALDAPMNRVAVDESVEDTSELYEMSDEELHRHARLLGDGESAPEGTREEFVVNYRGIDSYAGVFAVVLGPFFVCSVLAFGLLLFSVPIGLLGEIPHLIVVWLGLAVGAHSFPNAGATDALWLRSRAGRSPLRLIGYPVVAVSKLVNALRFLWLDAVYALLLFFFARDVVWATVLGTA